MEIYLSEFDFFGSFTKYQRVQLQSISVQYLVSFQSCPAKLTIH